MNAVSRCSAGAARWAVVLAGLAVSGCANQAALDAAGAGRLGDLRTLMVVDSRKGRLPGEARALARALAAGEIARAAGADGLERMRALEGCTRSLEDALDRKAEGIDEVAAAAAMMLLEARLVDPDDLRAKAPPSDARADGAALPEADAAWRAVRARTLTRARDAERRRQLLADGDERVRLAASRAAIDATNPGDIEALLDVARLDPAPLARPLAARALGVLGGGHVVAALKDLWPAADETLREAIVAAWAGPAARDVGGRVELVWAFERQKGTPALSAAARIAVDPGASPSERGEAVAILARAIEAGPERERVHALAVAPDAELVRAAVAKAELDHEVSVACAALARRLELPSGLGGTALGSAERTAVVARLVAIAGAGASADALRARAALARAGAAEVLPILERDLSSSAPRVRAAAGAAFARFGKRSRAVFLLSDADPHVRTATACAILSAPR